MGLRTRFVVPALIGLALMLAGCNWQAADNQPPQSAQSQATATAPITIAGDAASPAVAQPTLTSPGADAIGVPTTGTVIAPVTSTSPSPADAPSAAIYTVREGDTLSAVAAQFSTTVDALMQANDLSSPDIIFVGQTLKVVRSEVAASVVTPASVPQKQTTLVALAATSISKPTQPREVGASATTPTVAAIAATNTQPGQVVVNGVSYDAYNQAATKQHQWFHYSCEFDAAWVVLKTYGFEVSMDEQLAIVGVDKSVEPYYKDTADGVFIYGGDVLNSYSGSYATNFLARTTGNSMRRVFEHYSLSVTPVHDQESLEAVLRRWELVWIKTTADFKPGRPSTWVMPDGTTYQTVLGNDHAAVVMGYNSDGALIRDVLGPTSTNWQRQYEYLVPWPKFLAAWASQSYDGLAVAPPGAR